MHALLCVSTLLLLLLGSLPAWSQQPSRLDMSHPLNQRVVAWWRAVPGLGWTSTLYDLMGHTHGQLVTMDPPLGWAPSVRQGGFLRLGFNGSTSRVTFGTAPFMTNLPRMTLCAWIYPNSYGGTSLGRILNKRGTGGWSWQMNNVNVTNGMTFNQEFSGGSGRWGVANVLVTGAWQHVALTYDQTNPSNVPVFYINGRQPVATTPILTPSGTASSDAAEPLFLGNESSITQGFDGFIEDVRVYSALLDPATIFTIYSASQQGDPGQFLNYALRRDPPPLASTAKTDSLLPMFHPPRQGR